MHINPPCPDCGSELVILYGWITNEESIIGSEYECISCWYRWNDIQNDEEISGLKEF